MSFPKYFLFHIITISSPQSFRTGFSKSKLNVFSTLFTSLVGAVLLTQKYLNASVICVGSCGSVATSFGSFSSCCSCGKYLIRLTQLLNIFKSLSSYSSPVCSSLTFLTFNHSFTFNHPAILLLLALVKSIPPYDSINPVGHIYIYIYSAS